MLVIVVLVLLCLLVAALVRQNGRMLAWMEGAEEMLLQWSRDQGTGRASSLAFAVREETNDVPIVLEVVEQNEYRLPKRFEPDDVIIDVGCHIGSFAVAALKRGCGQVHCYDAYEPNLGVARRNLEPFGGRVRFMHAAVWRSDGPPASLHYQPSTDPRNLGGGGVLGDGGRRVVGVRFDDVVRDVTDGGARRVRLVKLDCEGSEYPILLTSAVLHLVDEVCGEFHVLPAEAFSACPDLAPRCTREEIVRVLETAGFDVEAEPTDAYNHGHFFARRSR